MMTLPPYELPRAPRSAFLDPYRGCGARKALDWLRNAEEV